MRASAHLPFPTLDPLHAAQARRLAAPPGRNLRAALPQVPASLCAYGEEQALLRKLERLFAWLDRKLDGVPIDVEPCAHGREVHVFEAISYRVSPQRRTVAVLFRVDGVRVPQPINVELRYPLCTPHWIEPLLAHLGIAQGGAQRHLFMNGLAQRRQVAWLTGAAWERVRRDERFMRLRRQLLPSGLALDRELVTLALRSRTLPREGVNSRVYNRIWRNEELFRRVADENASLLPLVSLAVGAGVIQPGEDPVAAVRRRFLADNVTPAGWRYVAKHGARIFREVWQTGLEEEPLDLAARTTVRLQDAGLPPLPPRPLGFLADWWGAPAQVLGIVLRELRAAQADGRYGSFVDDARLVMSWASAEEPVLDSRQRASGWRWALRRAREWSRRRIALHSHVGPNPWHTAIATVSAGRFTVVALNSVEAVLEEATVMHNCMADYIGACQKGTGKFFSVRAAASGQRLAVAYLGLDPVTKRWRLDEIARPMNACVEPTLRALGEQLALLYEQADTSPRHLVEPPPPREPARCATIFLRGPDG